MQLLLSYDEIIDRIGFFRTRANLSSRELSLKLGYNAQFIKSIETKKVELKIRTLIEICEELNISLYEFFYLGKQYNEESEKLLNMFGKLSAENKNLIMELMERLR